ncbi:MULTISPECIES: Bug family tripartite tricarboxylate transporter substrate binding protein [Roseomonadaceae]|uniref:Tripartite tricarboxylate transporter substrate binding protein n=1 Tax=Falsiroseomonas oleicola TaxID=2801474 RepID=A0ABS6HEI8_9PROT|nr:tripartite tricarboxylate transporter substrate binding protein [Roseomonas oleicola]MBU8547162.1 tripartite tricarboxylate transporter substrate binding protein [Roseomonas oleicola]
MTFRRTLLAALPGLLAARAALGQPAGYPTRPIRFVVPWAPGGATGNIARIVGDAMAASLGQAMVFDHRPGAGGALGTDNVAKSAGDGYTLLISGAATYYRPLIDKDTPFNPARDFTPLGLIGVGPFCLVTRNGLPGNLRDFIAHARANPGKLNFASSGIGATSHLAAEAFNASAGIQATHVPYRGSSPATIDLIAGRVDYYFDAFSSLQDNVRGGRIQALGVTTAERASQAPDVPSIAEAALPGFTAAPWWGIVGPAGLTPAVLDRLSAALKTALETPAVVALLDGQGCTAQFMAPGPFGAFVQAENAKWTQVIEKAGLRVS